METCPRCNLKTLLYDPPDSTYNCLTCSYCKTETPSASEEYEREIKREESQELWEAYERYAAEE